MIKEITVFICDVLATVAIMRSFFFFDAIEDYVDAMIRINSESCPISPSFKEKAETILKKGNIWLVVALCATILRSGFR